MTVSNTDYIIAARGNGATTVFPYNFRIDSEELVSVYLQDADTRLTTEELLPGDYSIAGLGVDAGGTVTYTGTSGPLTSGYYLVIERVEPYVQPLDISTYGSYNPAAVEGQLDKLEMQIQQVKGEADRGMKTLFGIPPYDVGVIEPGYLLQMGEDGLIGQGPNGEAIADAAEAALRAEAAADRAMGLVGYCLTLTDLKALSTLNGWAYLATAGMEGFYIWLAGDFTGKGEDYWYVESDSLFDDEGIWFRVTTVDATVRPGYFHYADFRPKFASDQLAFEALITAAFLYATSVDNTAGIDLDGMRIVLSKPVDVATLTGQSSNAALISMANGSFEAVASSDWTTETFIKTLTWTKNSNIMTMASTASLSKGMYLVTGENLSFGIPRYTTIISVDSATQITVSTYPWKSGSGVRTFAKNKFMLDFSGMNSSNKRFMNINAECRGYCSYVKLPGSGQNWTFTDGAVRGVLDFGILDWNDCAGGFVAKGIEMRPFDNAPSTRVAIGVLLVGGDSKFHHTRIIGFQHSLVAHGGSYIIAGCHNFQGASDVAAVRTSAFLFTGSGSFISMTGNYIDNGGIEFTQENQGSYPPNPFRSVSIVSNIFTMTSTALPGSFGIEFTPCIDGADLTQITDVAINANVFRKLGDALDDITNLRTALGNIDPTQTIRFSMRDNTYVSIANKRTSVVKSTLSKATPGPTWPFGTFSTVLPFGMTVQQITAIALGGTAGLFDGSSTRIYPSANAWLNSGVVEVLTSVAAKGQITVTVDCSN